MKKGIKNAKLNGSEAVSRYAPTSPVSQNSTTKTPPRMNNAQRMFNAANAFPSTEKKKEEYSIISYSSQIIFSSPSKSK